ncbi:MAG: hypothetical protein ACYC4U_22305 [Pirellulaceae bacterium]
MSAASQLKYLHLAYFSKPIADRTVYRTIRNIRPGHLVGIGLGCGQLVRNMIQLASEVTRRDQVRFTGIDLFELRPSKVPGMSLKQAHSLLASLKARVKLVPGDPFSALARTANSLPDTDLVVIRADQDPGSLERAWYYLPRMLHDQSVVLIETTGGDGSSGTYQSLNLTDVHRLAGAHLTRRRAA